MDTVGSVQLAVLVGAVSTLAAVVLQVAGRWPGGRPAFGPFQSAVLAVSLVGVSMVYAAVLEVVPWAVGEIGMIVAIAACSVSAGVTWERRHAVSRWRWPWQRQPEAGP
jgi:hypothetical protein